MKNELDNDFVREEYFHLQDTIESFDEKALTIKAWSVTVSMAGVGAAFVEEAPVLLLLASGASMLFWLIEGLWKSFQQANYHRIDEIEAFMKGNVLREDFVFPDITGGWNIGWRKTSLHEIMFWSHVYLPHAVVVVLGVVLWLANQQMNFVGAT